MNSVGHEAVIVDASSDIRFRMRSQCRRAIESDS
jgi:hypothetical protein